MSQPDFYHLPKEVRDGLIAARARHQRATGGRLRVQVGDDWYPIRSCDDTGFEVGLDAAPKLRGLVEIHDGPRVVRSALIVAGDPNGDAMRYEFKRVTAARQNAPLDYERDGEAPAGLITVR
ncbi:hypothetical protein ACK8OR_09120 [Jannaschia sp. KMU-145]|uniref:hypothetical protein n=1 Tax=Jannaschia halovivens TaxID=3388667 RepID=UPI00396B2EDD